MTPSGQKAPGTGGGSVAIRGFLVQTLVALLDIAQAAPPFIDITLEPALGDEQFDFVWTDVKGVHATQVKSTINTFGIGDVKTWASKLEAARSGEDCCLMLVGNIPASLDGISQLGAVRLEKKNLNLNDLVQQAAHRLSLFVEAEGMNPGKATEREMIVHALVSKLAHLSAKSEPLSREAFVKLLRQWINTAPKDGRSIDIGRIDKYAPAELIGREAETRLLSDAWDQAVSGEAKRPRVLTFVALGGEGKTSLVAKWAAGLAHRDWPGCDAVFAWSFYSQGTRESGSSDVFLKEALIFFGDTAMANSAQGAFDKGRRLVQLVGERWALLILDGLEPLQYAPTSPMRGQLKDQGLAALLKGLAAHSLGLCVVTTRYPIADLRSHLQGNVQEVPLTRLSKEAGVTLLQHLGVRKESGTREQFEQLVENVQGHALTLNLLGTYLRDAHGGDIRKRDLVNLAEADAENEYSGHAFRVIEAYVHWFGSEGDKGHRAIAILRLLGLFDRPASADCFAALLKPPVISGMTKGLVGLSEAQLNLTLARLEAAQLLTVYRDAAGTLMAIDTHALLREYFGQERRSQHLEAWRAAHRRLYEHLCSTTKEGAQPTLEDLQPLYQAIAHGCQAGLQQEACDKVYFARIQRGKEGYSMKKLGAFGSDLGAIACFFETPWSRLSNAITKADKAWLLHEAAYPLRALGRLSEALDPMRVAGEMIVKGEQWEGAAISYSNLSELELTLGEVVGAVGDAEQSVTFADRSGDTFRRCVNRVTVADALHQAGRRAEAESRFREAEQMQAARRPAYPLLSGIAGFRYCGLLLTEAERGAWQKVVQDSSSTATIQAKRDTSSEEPMPDGPKIETILAALSAVSERAAHTLKIAERDNWLLDIALDHLTLGRAALYVAVLDQSAIPNPQSEIDSAVSDLRRGGDIEFVALGLLSRAWLRSLTSARTGPESAQSDLDEAWDIAERGPMPLFLADIHLHRARLFFHEASYPWESPQQDLAEARRLIFKHGYLRRKEELEDAEAAILGER